MTEPLASGSLCPLCHRPTAPAFRPFCSAHCQQRDLLKWLNEDYRITVPDPETDEAPDDADSDES